MYSVDTNIFIDWWERYYPPDIFPSVKNNLEHLVASKKLFSPSGVFEEIKHNGSNDLIKWAKQNKKIIFCPHDTNLQSEANKILKSFPGLIDSDARHDEADRYVIALAKLMNFTVVTSETAASSKSKKHRLRTHYIPDVCSGLGIKCINLVGLMRAENWTI